MRSQLERLKTLPRKRSPQSLSQWFAAEWDMHEACYAASGRLRLVVLVDHYLQVAERYLRLAVAEPRVPGRRSISSTSGALSVTAWRQSSGIARGPSRGPSTRSARSSTALAIGLQSRPTQTPRNPLELARRLKARRKQDN